MSVNLFNYTPSEVTDHIAGTEVTIPPHGVTQTSEKKAAGMIARHPGKLGLAPKPAYTEAEFAALESLSHHQLVLACTTLMHGGKLDMALIGDVEVAGPTPPAPAAPAKSKKPVELAD